MFEYLGLFHGRFTPKCLTANIRQKMTPYPNLISQSLLINETVNLLRSFGGRASAVSIVDFVMKIRRPQPELAVLLVGDLIDRDPRLRLNGEMVESTDMGFES